MRDLTLYKELIGEAIDNYIIDAFIGLGGQAVVFLAHGKGLPNIKYALKIFGLLGQATARLDDGLKDAQNQSLVDHPSVVKVYEPGIADIILGGLDYRVFYVPMQYAPLGNCDDDPPYKDKELTIADIKTLIGLLDGLNTIHEAGIIHRDIKPANILRFEERQPAQFVTVLRITDFGIAKVLSAIGGGYEAASGVTPAYMSPEQLDHQHSVKGDIYSMGATLFYMITGQNPIPDPVERNNVFAWQAAHRETPRPNAVDYNPRCPVRLALLIMRMMSIKPDQRPSLDDCIAIMVNYIETLEAKLLGFRLPEKLRDQIAVNKYQIRYIPEFAGIFDPAVHILFGTKLYAIRIQMSRPIFKQYKLLIEYMVKKFSDCFCMYETYGTYDIHIFLWSDSERIAELESDLDSQYAESIIEASPVKQIDHLHANNINVTDSSINGVGALAVQEEISLPGVNPDLYLCGNYPERIPEHSVRAFIYVEAVRTNSPDFQWLRVAIVERVHRKMREMVKMKDKVKQTQPGMPDVTISRNRFPRLSVIELEPDPQKPQKPVMIVNYVARDYKFLHEIATAIIELGDTAVKTSTFLETGRIIIQSDKILF
ncbi:MAG: eukaryotic-like serine/threonine-protein kinase [Acidobacteriota bacterium]|nr:eukaryotic-like serine/threonine-protein kinase [Acidobacteriota bacterium]